MTAALAGGGQLCAVNNQPLLLTENAPVTVINESPTSRIYLAASSNVSSVTGVPVEAGTSYNWETPGPLYAILDPGAPDPSAAVVLTNAGGQWSPSPVAIGAAVATELLETGVSIKYLDTLIQSGLILNNGVPSPGLDVTGYSEVLITGFQAAIGFPPADPVQYAFADSLYNPQMKSLLDNYQPNQGFGTTRFFSYRLKVTASILWLSTPSVNSWNVTVYGSSRNSLLKAIESDITRDTASMANWSTSLPTGTPAGTYAMPMSAGYYEQPSGLCSCYIRATATTQQQWNIYLSLDNAVGSITPVVSFLTDNGRCALVPGSTGNYSANLPLAFPVANYTPMLNLPTALTAGLILTLNAIPA